MMFYFALNLLCHVKYSYLKICKNADIEFSYFVVKVIHRHFWFGNS